MRKAVYENTIPSWLQTDKSVNTCKIVNTYTNNIMVSSTASNTFESDKNELLNGAIAILLGASALYLLSTKKISAGAILKLIGSMIDGDMK